MGSITIQGLIMTTTRSLAVAPVRKMVVFR